MQLLEKLAVHQQLYQMKLNEEQFLCIRIIPPHYRARAGQSAYEANRRNSSRTYNFVAKSKFINYVDAGLIGIKNHHLPEKISRKPKQNYAKANKRKLGRSIEERHSYINNREEFGHCECDLILGAKTKDDKFC